MIELNKVSFRYAADKKEALADISLKIKEGEFILLTGKSGCGKTTVTRLINGLVPHFYEGVLEGGVVIGGRNVQDMRMHELADQVGSVFQDPRSQFFTTDTASEIAFACENAGIPRKELQCRVSGAVRDLHIEYLYDRNIFTLSSGEKQSVAIASVYALAPKIYVLDEPSANLDMAATGKLRQTLIYLKNKGCTIIVSEHRLHYLRDLADKVILLENGRVSRIFDKSTFMKLENKDAKLQGLRCMTVEQLELGNPSGIQAMAPVLELTDISYSYPGGVGALDGISFLAGSGEIVGLVGHNGAGKSTLVELVCGLRKEKSGNLKINGKKAGVKQRIRSTYYVMQDSDYQLITESVEKEFLLGGGKDPDLLKKAEHVMKLLDLTDFRDSHPASLSGGQKQRVSIAPSYMKDADIVCLDEPTSGLDLVNMIRTASLLQELAKMGKTVIVISHDHEFLACACTRIIHISGGRVEDDFVLCRENKGRFTKSLNLFQNQ